VSPPSRQSPGFSGPSTGPPARSARPRVSVRLPRSVIAELASVRTTVQRVRDGDSPGALGDVEHRLLQRVSFGPNAAMAARLEAIGHQAFLAEQLDYERIDDSELEDTLREALPTLTMSSVELYTRYVGRPFLPVYELWVATVFRAIYSPRQLFERMVTFWSDHFSIDVFADEQFYLKPVDDREVIRPHALGSFPELLSASAHSPAMLVFLTNDSNYSNFPNENYARELMELHTMGADNGYTEQDVKEVARCFTGWTYSNPSFPQGLTGAFRFSSFVHDTGSKRVLGRSIPAGRGIEDGDRVIEILSRHRNTAEYISTKLLRYLWGYDPPRSAVRAVRRTYQRTNGNIRAMVRTALSPRRLANAGAKVKRPFHLMVGGVRALGGNVEQPGWLIEQMIRAGHSPFAWSPPDGYPDDPVYWSGFLLPRWNYAAELLGDTSGVVFDPSIDDPSGGPEQIVDRIDALLMQGRMTDETRATLESFIRNGRATRRRVREAIALALSAPEFQEY
jgi:hypothetical protein